MERVSERTGNCAVYIIFPFVPYWWSSVIDVRAVVRSSNNVVHVHIHF